MAREMGDWSERVQKNNDIKEGNRDLSSLIVKIAKIQEESRNLFRRVAELTELIRKRIQEKAEANRQAEQPAQPEESVTEDFLKKLNSDRGK